ncbi:hypothetical protein BJN43_26500 [Escherichia coli]|nr:hypothetical protein BJN43_26500 [Escherichia coli]
MLLIIRRRCQSWRLWCSPYCTEQSPRHLRRRKPGNEQHLPGDHEERKGIPALVVKEALPGHRGQKVKQEHAARQDHRDQKVKQVNAVRQVHRDQKVKQVNAARQVHGEQRAKQVHVVRKALRV